MNLLSMAACYDRLDLVKFLLEKGLVEVDSTDLYGRTALHYAASNGYMPIAEVLLQHGATLNQRNHARETPLMRACMFGELEMVRFFLDREGVEISNTNTVNFIQTRPARQPSTCCRTA